MRVLNLLPLLPFALAAPTKQTIPELSVSDWHSIQSGFQDGLRSLSSWSVSKAEEMIDRFEEVEAAKDDSLTIWGQLKADPNSFSKLVKVIEFEETAIKYLDDNEFKLTFFAPNNDALTPPDHHHHHDDDDDLALVELMQTPSLSAVSAALESDRTLSAADDDDDDDKKKRRRQIFKFIVKEVLKYHGLMEAYTLKEIGENVTVPTALKAEDGSFGGLQRRIRIEKSLIPPSVKLNFYAKVLVSDIQCSNGYLHTIDHPLLPPGSIFESAFLFPDTFATLTSAVQGLDARKFLEWHYDKEESTPGNPKFTGTPLTTLFAPTNFAFGRLPPKLKLFLFSPFGEKALAKVLMYHYIPKTLLLSELLYTEKDSEIWGFNDKVEAMEYFNMDGDTNAKKEIIVKPALPNSELRVEVERKKVLPIDDGVRTIVKVNGVYVTVIDVPARNGAIHVIDTVLVPPHKHHDHASADISSVDSWENWEQWLPAFADEE